MTDGPEQAISNISYDIPHIIHTINPTLHIL